MLRSAKKLQRKNTTNEETKMNQHDQTKKRRIRLVEKRKNQKEKEI